MEPDKGIPLISGSMLVFESVLGRKKTGAVVGLGQTSTTGSRQKYIRASLVPWIG